MCDQLSENTSAETCESLPAQGETCSPPASAHFCRVGASPSVLQTSPWKKQFKSLSKPAQSLFHFTSGVKCSIPKTRWLVSLVKHTHDYFLIVWVFF